MKTNNYISDNIRYCFNSILTNVILFFCEIFIIQENRVSTIARNIDNDMTKKRNIFNLWTLQVSKKTLIAAILQSTVAIEN